ncbi:MAG: bacillithiol biosynthesis cysteine-adding enzyme BshC [Bacteroidia bacterium]|nr:bacillithiol biosynthesis cysteine-adding enzyme BshC [Bacteroidia bacterium]
MQVKNVPFPKGFLSPTLQRLSQESIEGYKPYPLMGINDSVDSLKEHYLKHFPIEHREILVSVIRDQYSEVDLSPSQEENLTKLSQPDGITVTTGQQIHPFLGPQFVYNKVFTAIITAAELDAVPIFWMATEDHDFDELKTVHFLGKTYVWETNQTGPVGKFTTEGVVVMIDQMLIDFPHDQKLKNLLQELKVFYGPEIVLADATRMVVQYFWGHTGILCLDPNNTHLKRCSSDIFRKEILGEFKKSVDIHIEGLIRNEIPVNIPTRETHLFYFPEGDGVSERLRIDRKSDELVSVTGGFSWSQQELLNEVLTSPERFSPNVLLRPIFQQCILPNVVYVAGPSEFMYWLELGNSFEDMGVKAPRLQLRFSSLFISKQNQKRIDSLKLDIVSVFNDDISVESQLKEQFNKNFQLEMLQSELGNDFEKIWNELYSLKIPDLKSLKKSHQQILKELKVVSVKYKNGEYGENELSKALKIWNSLRQELFNKQLPQERREFFLESVVKYDLPQIEESEICNHSQLLLINM